MTFTDFDRGHGQGLHGLGKMQKKDELLMASSTLSGPASVSRQRANHKTGALRPASRTCLTPWQYGQFCSYCPAGVALSAHRSMAGDGRLKAAISQRRQHVCVSALVLCMYGIKVNGGQRHAQRRGSPMIAGILAL
jgi:hypothetical protein